MDVQFLLRLCSFAPVRDAGDAGLDQEPRRTNKQVGSPPDRQSVLTDSVMGVADNVATRQGPNVGRLNARSFNSLHPRQLHGHPCNILPLCALEIDSIADASQLSSINHLNRRKFLRATVDVLSRWIGPSPRACQWLLCPPDSNGAGAQAAADFMARATCPAAMSNRARKTGDQCS
jgi:hypothetical protein